MSNRDEDLEPRVAILEVKQEETKEHMKEIYFVVQNLKEIQFPFLYLSS